MALYVDGLLDKAGQDVGLPALVCSPKALRAISCAPGAAVDADHARPPGTATGLISAEPVVECAGLSTIEVHIPAACNGPGVVTSPLAVTDASVDASIDAVADHARPPDLLMQSDALGPVLSKPEHPEMSARITAACINPGRAAPALVMTGAFVTLEVWPTSAGPPKSVLRRFPEEGQAFCCRAPSRLRCP